ncbi:MAG: hypothetical protein IJS13_08195 [Paludibacteraceae bacterium]|nr:hypothetical protein [Paludibacteraceae bacterium]
MKIKHHILLLCLLVSSCEGTTFVSSVPSYPVHFEINILAEYPHFVPSGGIDHLVFTSQRYYTDAVGYAGLLVYTAFDEQYHACDLCCPKCLKRYIPIEPDGMYAHCPTCGEDYDLSYGLGNPTKGISKEMLRPYHCSYANGKLLIY